MQQRIGGLRQPLNRLVNRSKTAFIYYTAARRLGLTRVEESDPSDVFIAGYPKSGNQWFHNLAAGVVYGIDPEYAPDTLIKVAVPDTHSTRFYRRLRTPNLIATHQLPKPRFRRAVYLVRDGRDVIVSAVHHLDSMFNLGTDHDAFVRMVTEGSPDDPNTGLWQDHVRAWLDNPFGTELLVIRYEDLKSDGLTQLKRFADFYGVERDDRFLENILFKASFEKMREKERQFGWAYMKPADNKPFMRRGKTGSYRDEMPPDVLELFLARARPSLERCGYGVDEPLEATRVSG